MWCGAAPPHHATAPCILIGSVRSGIFGFTKILGMDTTLVMLLFKLASALGHAVFLEQPFSSLMHLHHRFQDMSPPPPILFFGSPCINRVDMVPSVLIYSYVHIKSIKSNQPNQSNQSNPSNQIKSIKSIPSNQIESIKSNQYVHISACSASRWDLHT